MHIQAIKGRVLHIKWEINNVSCIDKSDDHMIDQIMAVADIISHHVIFENIHVDYFILNESCRG